MIRQLNSQKLNPISPETHKHRNTIPQTNKDLSFNQILQDKLSKESLKYSKHADFKMKSLGIVKNDNLKSQLNKAANQAKEKNIQEGLILTDDYGFVVSIKNSTVITVVNLKDMKENIFTNIDGAVII